MKRIVIFLLLFFFLLFGTYLIAQQNDTSSYFPIGLWGVWIDKEKPPFTRDLLSIEWDREVSNWNSINGNFLVYWIPYWMQDDMLDFADNNGYKMDISNFYYWSTHPELPNSLHRWMYLTNPTETELISIINDIKTTYGAHPGFFNYTFGEETPVADPYYWPRVELISQKISELDPGRKSYMVSGGVPLEAFFNATPHLDILQVDVYTIWSPYEQKYSDQQYVFDQSLYHFSTTMDRIKDRHTEWHAIIQAQRDFRQTTPSCPNYLRRPNF